MPAALPLVDGRLPAWLERHRSELPPRARLPFEPWRWAGALVVVERGALELETRRGARLRLEPKAVLYLAGLPLRALRNPGDVPTVLVAIMRRRP